MNRRDFLKLGGAGLSGVLLGACGLREAEARSGRLKAEFRRAAREHGVPAELLLAMGYVNTLWEMPPPTASDYEPGTTEGRGDYGIMALAQNPSRDTLGKAAELTGLPEEKIKRDRAANVEAGAALLSELRGRSSRSGLDDWKEAVTRYADTELYTQAVFEVLKRGAARKIKGGEQVRLAAQEGVEAPKVYTYQGAADYPRADWRPAHGNNYTRSNRERSYNINRIVIHVAQGSFASAINWFQDPRARVSAHYVINRNGRVVQCVRNKDIAWHAGNWNYNTHSIGIEHAGYVNNPDWFSKKMYNSSARLAAFLVKKHRIPLDRRHIIGHSRVPGADHTDPGRHWNWRRYMRLIRRFARR
ncbi:MAG: peptidoglycan recognition family protein [Actinomycetota bacterium]